MRCCMYLRKSRSDQNLPGCTEAETLARHEKALYELAERMQLDISAVYREVASGETISGRPMMQRLLTEVENGLWDGVLVMEIERLARGNTVDQGIITRVFRCANTQIITPAKVYDPDNEFDEEYFEFSLFMSRREYKAINRRMQRGRLASVKEGKFVGSVAPFGYEKVKLKDQKGYTLLPHPIQAEIVATIYAQYTVERLPANQIAARLNADGLRTAKGNLWTQNAVLDILKNPVYCGRIRWNHRPVRQSTVKGEPVIHRPRSDLSSEIVINGIHPGIVSEETFLTAQRILERKKQKKAE